MKKLNSIKSTRLLIVLLSVLLVSLSGCDVEKNTDSTKAARTVVHVTTGKGVDCVVSRFEDSYRGGISCNWQEYNDKIKVCKDESLKRRTMEDGQTFPSVQGECKKAN